MGIRGSLAVLKMLGCQMYDQSFLLAVPEQLLLVARIARRGREAVPSTDWSQSCARLLPCRTALTWRQLVLEDREMEV